MKKILSIIIPCYNVEKYIVTCLESVYSTGLHEEKFEVILVDDESPDQVVKIASDYLVEKTNYKIIRQTNRGLGGARNTGIKNASGKYIIFLDPDDTLVLRNYNFLENCNADIVQLASENISIYGDVISAYNPPDIKNITGRKFWLNNLIMPSACNKIYLRSFLNKYSLEFKDHLYSEDIEFNARAFFYAQHVTVKGILIQRFLQSPNSITRNKSITSRKKLFDDLFNIIKYLVIFKKDNSKSLEDKKYFDKIISDVGLGVLNLGLRNSIEKSEIIRVRRFLLDNKIPIFTIVYDNKNKNLFKYILRMPFSINLLKLIFTK
ncbi:glycosyltransferase family 2 protein [Kaistella polysaccharea]|uniref:glycosyltransferase family 2 protein n=1 Tax=Kaistella polysaccharea TaxID=2878534 RepID=UPI001CF5D74F|nr:glycosyltransferase family 2 protein [Kaistella polysaccharea]